MAETPHGSLADFLQNGVHAPQCAICKEDYISGAPLPPANPSNQIQTIIEIEQCRHRFHKACLMEWIRLEGGRNICPTCHKALFSTIQEKNVELDNAGHEMFHAIERVRDVAAWFVRNNVAFPKLHNNQREMMVMAESGTDGWDAAWNEIDMADAEDEYTAVEGSSNPLGGQHAPLSVSQKDMFDWSDDEDESTATQGQVSSPDGVQSSPLAQDHSSTPIQGHSSSAIQLYSSSFLQGSSFLPPATTTSSEISQGGTNGNTIGQGQLGQETMAHLRKMPPHLAEAYQTFQQDTQRFIQASITLKAGTAEWYQAGATFAQALAQFGDHALFVASENAKEIPHGAYQTPIKQISWYTRPGISEGAKRQGDGDDSVPDSTSVTLGLQSNTVSFAATGFKNVQRD